MSPPAVPETVVAPVLVIPDPARTAKLELLPRRTVGSALESVEFRVKIAYPEQHMQKLFSVLQKIAAQQYKITYNPEADTKSFWDIFTGE
jgi:hypothetical protein